MIIGMSVFLGVTMEQTLEETTIGLMELAAQALAINIILVFQVEMNVLTFVSVGIIKIHTA